MPPVFSTPVAMPPPPRTPSPKIRIHRSQSFDSPSSRISVTPIDDSPYSKSASALQVAKPLPSYNVHGMITHVGNKIVLKTKMSNESMSDVSSIDSSPVSPNSESSYPLFSSGSPSLPSAPSPPSAAPARAAPPTSIPIPEIVTPEQYQDPSTPMYDPWLVRVVLDLYDIRGLDWTCIAEPIERMWGFRTSSGEVLSILVANGRVGGVRWWD